MRIESAPMAGFPVVNGVLCAGGEALTSLAERVGTPFFVYDSSLIAARMQALRELLPVGLGVHYALKANPLPALVSFMAGCTDGMDVASASELQCALEAGMAPHAISLAGPGKTDALLQAALAAGVRINVESSGELRRIAALPQHDRARLSLRVNPAFTLKSAGMRMGGGASPFGIDEEQVPAALALARELGLNVDGLHFYPGSQILHAETLMEVQAYCLTLALRLAVDGGMPLRVLNLGGGFGIPYFPGDKPLALAPVAAGLAALHAQAESAWPGIDVQIELGRYLVGEAGLYVTRIVDRKVSRGKTFLITDGGMNHHLAASGNLGQVLRKNYPVAIGNRMDSQERENVTVAGPLCTPLDLLADKVELPPAQPGDLFVIYQSGAYGLSASPQGFLSHPAAKEIFL
jgi:diaminopimelate decarboxylase